MTKRTTAEILATTAPQTLLDTVALENAERAYGQAISAAMAQLEVAVDAALNPLGAAAQALETGLLVPADNVVLWPVLPVGALRYTVEYMDRALGNVGGPALVYDAVRREVETGTHAITQSWLVISTGRGAKNATASLLAKKAVYGDAVLVRRKATAFGDVI